MKQALLKFSLQSRVDTRIGLKLIQPSRHVLCACYINSGAPAARMATKRRHIPIQESKGNP